MSLLKTVVLFASLACTLLQEADRDKDKDKATMIHQATAGKWKTPLESR